MLELAILATVGALLLLLLVVQIVGGAARRALRRFVVALVLFVIVAVCVVFVFNAVLEKPTVPSYPLTIIIPQGVSTKTIGDTLRTRGLVSNPTIFVWTARIMGYSSRLRAGEHTISHPMNIVELIRELAKGGSFDITITVPEGFTIYDIAQLLDDKMGIDTLRFYSVVRDRYLLDSLGIKAPSMEGFLYPETYRLPKNLTAKEIVLVMFRQFDEIWQNKIAHLADSSGMSREKIVILASIVEAEAHTASERPIIASVYLNRLKRRMLLQADPTTMYAIRKFDTPLTLADLDTTSSPYNTYYAAGLPPGAICNPGLPSLEAVLHPATTDYLYFVARRNGTHIFSKTLKEHHRAIQRVREGKRKIE